MLFLQVYMFHYVSTVHKICEHCTRKLGHGSQHFLITVSQAEGPKQSSKQDLFVTETAPLVRATTFRSVPVLSREA